jgi:hypothetical protein
MFLALECGNVCCVLACSWRQVLAVVCALPGCVCAVLTELAAFPAPGLFVWGSTVGAID